MLASMKNALLVVSMVMALGAHAASDAVPTLRPTFAPTDEKVGTAEAPTTPGGACLNDADYSKWTTPQNVNGKEITGFDLLPVQAQRCAEVCATTLAVNSGDPDYGCGGFLGVSGACPPDLNAICVRDCMAGNPNSIPKKFPTDIIFYSLECAECFGRISFCAARNCTTCAGSGGPNSKDCRTCNENKCNPDFMICSGLNPTLKQEESEDITPILIGAVVGGVVLLALVVVLGTFHRMKTRKHRLLSPEELAKMAQAQSMAAITPGSQALSASYSGGGGSPKMQNVMSGSTQSSNPIYKGSPSTSPVLGASAASELTPYQQQYLAQQQAIAAGMIDPNQQPPQTRVAPSIRASRMASSAMTSGLPQSLIASARPLVVMYDFVGESNDELTCKVGDKIIGIEQQDGWWLAQDSNGVIGLISAAYCAVDTNVGAPGPSTSQVDPAF